MRTPAGGLVEREMQDGEFQRRRGARVQMILASVVGLVGFGVGWMVSFEQMGWRWGLLLGWWPAAVLGAGAAWVVGVGVPELNGIVARATMRHRTPPGGL
jgi:hypothetical protein